MTYPKTTTTTKKLEQAELTSEFVPDQTDRWSCVSPRLCVLDCTYLGLPGLQCFGVWFENPESDNYFHEVVRWHEVCGLML